MTPPHEAWNRLEDPAARTGLLLILLLHAVALLAPWISPFDPQQLGAPVEGRFLPPSSLHWMGTDLLGRDLFSRVLHGARVSLAIGSLSVVLNLVLGTLVGGLAGWKGGWIDELLMRFTDLFLAFPKVFLILALVAIFPPTTTLLILVLGFTGWMAVARLVRGSVLQLKDAEYVEAARALGQGGLAIFRRHLFPGVVAPLLAFAALRVGNAILIESFLSFLGLGVNDPQISWGMLIRGGRDTMLHAWWVSTFPGLAILLTVVSYNLLGDGLRDAYDPRLPSLGQKES